MKNTLIALTTLLLLNACFYERVDLDYNVDENKKVVISSFITTLNEAQFVRVSYTANYLGNDSQEGISNAKVFLKTDLVSIELTEQSPGYYYLPLDWEVEYNAVYNLEVKIGDQEYTATQRLRKCPEVENLHAVFIEDEDPDEDEEPGYYTLLFSIKDSPEEGDGYYLLDYNANDTETSFNNANYAEDEYWNGQYLQDIDLETEYNLGDTVVFDFHSVGLDAINFFEDISSEIYRDSPFDPPPANVSTNIEGGAIGYFIIADSRRNILVIE